MIQSNVLFNNYQQAQTQYDLLVAREKLNFEQGKPRSETLRDQIRAASEKLIDTRFAWVKSIREEEKKAKEEKAAKMKSREINYGAHARNLRF